MGRYQIDIPGHDDEAQLFIDGVKVWEHVGCCDSHTNVWTGILTDSSKVVFRGTEGGGLSYGSINIIPISSPISVTGNPVVCTGQYYTLTSLQSGTSYLWSNGDTTNPVQAGKSGNYSVSISKQGCSVNSDTVSITVLPDAAPVAHIS